MEGFIYMYPVIHLFGINLYPYGMMIAIGIVCAITIFMKRCKSIGYDEDSAFNLAIICCIAGIIGSKLLYIIVEFKDIIKHPLTIITDFGNGFVIYGGLILGILAALLYTKHKKWSFLKIFDIAAPLIALAQGFGRIGCLFAGCCYGRETNSQFGMYFKNSLYAPNNVKLIPTQLISSLGDFLIFGLLLLFDKRKGKKDGQTGSLYLILYSTGRFIIEFFRGDPRGTVLNVLSTSQFICLFVFPIGVILYVLLQKRVVQAVTNSNEASESSDEASENTISEEKNSDNNKDDQN